MRNYNTVALDANARPVKRCLTRGQTPDIQGENVKGTPSASDRFAGGWRLSPTLTDTLGLTFAASPAGPIVMREARLARASRTLDRQRL